MHRTIIVGGPRTGKTTLSAVLAREVGVVARHTDDLVGHVAFDRAHFTVARWMRSIGPWVIEGCATARALRHWLALHDDGRPVERVFWSSVPKVPQTRGQARMAKGIETVWSQIENDLRARGVTIVHF